MRINLIKILKASFSKSNNLFFKGKLTVFLFCVLIAAVFWLLNALTYKYSTVIYYPIRYDGSLKSKVVVNQLPKNIGLMLNGTGFDLISQELSFNKKDIHVNLSQILSEVNQNSNETTISTKELIQKIAAQFNRDLQIENIYPTYIHFKFEPLKTKAVKVILSKRISFKQQYDQTEPTKVLPAVVKISGPASIIDTLNSLSTDSLVRTNLDKNLTAIVNIKNPDSARIKIDPKKVLVQMSVAQYTEGEISLPIHIINLPIDYTMKTFPSKIKVSYLVPLNKYEQVTPQLFKAQVDYKDIVKNHLQTTNIKVTTSAKYIDILYFKPEKAEYIITKND